MEKYFQNNPQAKQQFENNQLLLKQSLNNNTISRDRSAWDTIPVVYHIYIDNLMNFFYNKGVNDSIVLESLKIMNEYFARERSDTGTIAVPFKNLYVNSNIKFMLAKKDPLGNCSTGIIYHYPTSGIIPGSTIDTSYSWNTQKYFNIHCRYSFPYFPIPGSSGWASMPGFYNTGSPYDVVGVDFAAIKNLTGSSTVLTHEAGHWLNLPHIFGGSTDTLTCGDDGILDTPPSVKPLPYSSLVVPCPSSLTGNSCDSSGTNNIENIMHYHYCPKNFTQGQTNVMKATLASSVSGRNNLSTTANLIATGVNLTTTCPPEANFCAYHIYNNSQTTINLCQNDSVHFFDLSLNGEKPTSWNWSFPGGNPSNSSLKNPTVFYTTPGTYNVKLKVSNAYGSDSITKVGVVIVNPIVGTLKTALSENFESISSIPLTPQTGIDWYTASTSDWQLTSSAAYSGQKSIIVSTNSNTFSYFTSNFIVKMDSLSFITFKHAYAMKDSLSKDGLYVEIKDNCSLNPNGYIQPFYKTDINLSTIGNAYINGSFIPTLSQWVTDTIYKPQGMKDNIHLKFSLFQFVS